MLNKMKDTWKLIKTFEDLPKLGMEVFALIENDVILNEEDNFCFTAQLFLRKEGENLLWELHPDDQEDTEKYLQQCFSVVAWRYKDL